MEFSCKQSFYIQFYPWSLRKTCWVHLLPLKTLVKVMLWIFKILQCLCLCLLQYLAVFFIAFVVTLLCLRCIRICPNQLCKGQWLIDRLVHSICSNSSKQHVVLQVGKVEANNSISHKQLRMCQGRLTAQLDTHFTQKSASIFSCLCFCTL